MTPEREAEIRALCWEHRGEDCSDHQAAVNDLLEALDAERERNAKLEEAARWARGYVEMGSEIDGDEYVLLGEALAALDTPPC